MLRRLLFLPLVVDVTGPAQANYSLPGLFMRIIRILKFPWLIISILAHIDIRQMSFDVMNMSRMWARCEPDVNQCIACLPDPLQFIFFLKMSFYNPHIFNQ
jgi:hypothetical protein